MRKNKALLALGIGIGIAVGFFAKRQYNQYERTSPEVALKNAREKFKEKGPINGSWIYMQPEEVEIGGLTYNAYRGAISRLIDGENKQFEFFADLNTGAILSSVDEH